jgi:phage terminase small subunit
MDMTLEQRIAEMNLFFDMKSDYTVKELREMAVELGLNPKQKKAELKTVITREMIRRVEEA